MLGLDKRGYVQALQQTKFYLPRQAAAAKACVLWRSSTRGAAVHKILFYPSCTAARVLRQLYGHLVLL